jgi:hypothetical protein
MSSLAAFSILGFLVGPASAQSMPALLSIEQHVGLVLLIASAVIIVLMILILFFLQNISEHLNWIRRMR